MQNNEFQIAMHEAIQKVAVGPDRGRDLSEEHCALVMRGILQGEIDEVQIAVFLIALRMKRESMSEFLGLYQALSENTEFAIAKVDSVTCLADPFDGYLRNNSMTPFIPAVLAALKIPAVIHGVETIGPKHGVTAHKVYRQAGIDCLKSPMEVANLLTGVNWGFVDQSRYASSLYSLLALRNRIVKRTALTTLERLLVPIRGQVLTHLVLGYVHKAYPSIYARVAKSAGFDSVLLLKGVEGGLAPALNKPLRRFFFEGELPIDIDSEKELINSEQIFSSSTAAASFSDSQDPVEECLSTGLSVLSGTKCLARDSLSLAAANIVFAHGHATTLVEAVDNVQRCLDNGSAQACFQSLIDCG